MNVRPQLENVVFVAIELSATKWLIAGRSPSARKSRFLQLDAGDTEGLLAFLQRMKAEADGDSAISIVSCYEAGRDGFWLHRLLTAEGVSNHVLEPTSILVNRRSRRAKTDRLDAEGMLRVLQSHWNGDLQACSMVHVPTPEEEDAKRQHRERDQLVQERVRIENRIEALLATLGIRKRPSLRSWERDMAALRTGDRRSMPPCIRAELDRLRRRLVFVREMIREVEIERTQKLAAAPDEKSSEMIKTLSQIRGVGENFADILTREVFYRRFSNRRHLASYVGIAPMPHQSGAVRRDQGIGRAGNPRARKALIQLAWLWLRYQPESSLSHWFKERVGELAGRTRRIAIVAMARKLLIALWRFVETGLVPEGVVLRPQI